MVALKDIKSYFGRIPVLFANAISFETYECSHIFWGRYISSATWVAVFLKGNITYKNLCLSYMRVDLKFSLLIKIWIFFIETKQTCFIFLC
jgi:hypothetical protein